MGNPELGQVRLHPRAAWRTVAGEVFVVTDDRAFHRLAVPSATAIFAALEQGPTDLDAIVAQLCERFEVEAGVARREADRFVRTLLDRGIAAPAEGEG